MDETGDTLHTTTVSEAANGGHCDTLDVVVKDFTMTLSTTLAKALIDGIRHERASTNSSSSKKHMPACRLRICHRRPCH